VQKIAPSHNFLQRGRKNKKKTQTFWGGCCQLFVNFHLSQGFLELNPQEKRGMTLLAMKGRDNVYSTFFNSRGDLKTASVWS
jgi:hypothetical protein